MPIFEYRCKTCGAFFEAIVTGSTVPECPTCHGAELDKQLSVFAVGASDRSGSPSIPDACRSCGDPRGPGGCGMN